MSATPESGSVEACSSMGLKFSTASDSMQSDLSSSAVTVWSFSRVVYRIRFAAFTPPSQSPPICGALGRIKVPPELLGLCEVVDGSVGVLGSKEVLELEDLLPGAEKI